MIINLLKEKIVEAGDTRGYIINGFPRNAKQSNLFVKEIANVDCIILLEGSADLVNALNNGKNIGSEDSLSQYAENSVQKSAKNVIRNPIEKEEITADEQSGDKRSQDMTKYEDLFANGVVKYDLLIEKV